MKSSKRKKPVDDSARPSWPVRCFASVLGSGWSPFASGTAGSAVALAIWWFIPWLQSWQVLVPAIVIVIALGIPASAAMEKWLGQDPAPVVIDELAGMWISVVLVPPAPLNAAAAFLLFRFFDIVKPPPARQFDRLHGGTGIMMDDVAAGIYANIVLQLFLLLIR